jgi:hypothetical protein
LRIADDRASRIAIAANLNLSLYPTFGRGTNPVESVSALSLISYQLTLPIQGHGLAELTELMKSQYAVTLTITVEGSTMKEAMNAAHNSVLDYGLDSGHITVERTGPVMPQANLDAILEDEPQANLDELLG